MKYSSLILINLSVNNPESSYILRDQCYGIDVAKYELRKADELSERWLSPQSEVLEPALHAGKIATLLLDAPSDSEFRKIRAERAKRGHVAGQILAILYLMHRFELEEPSLKKAVFVSKEFAKKGKYGDGSQMPGETKIKEYWKEYMPVAHLWAAVQLNNVYPFTEHCFSQNGFPQFLKVAAGIYDFGINFNPMRVKPRRPLLNAQKCWVLDSTIEPLILKLEPEPKNLLKILKKYKAPKTVI